MDTSVESASRLARQRLAAELGGEPDDITLVHVEAVEWPDSSLGCPQPGMFYLQVITLGYRLILEHNGTQYIYHTDRGRRVVRCTTAPRRRP